MAPGGRQRTGSWKSVLALVSLALSLLLWLNGLLESLDRPSVVNDLARRQLELAVLAAPRVPAQLRPLLVGEDPEAALLAELERETAPAAGDEGAQEDPDPEGRLGQLERALLLQRQGRGAAARPLLQNLQALGDPQNQPLVNELLTGRAGRLPDPASVLPLPTDPLLRRLSCEVLGGSPARCAQPEAEQKAALQLAGVNLLPGLALLAGLVLLVREGWLRWRGKGAPLPALVGPDLSVVEVILLIAGGFVLLGELLTPLLVSPLITWLLARLGIGSPLAEGLSVLGLYLGLMAAPLAILALLLRGRPDRPDGGWLQFRWRPVGASLPRALRYLLMVLPLVSLVGWLQQLLWADAGGSNPLLELVLRSESAVTLACFAFTAIVLAPLFEETIFRGVLLPVVARQAGPLWGILLSSLVFGIAHLSLGELPALFTLGLGLGWLRLSSGRLSSSIWLHALWNALTFSNLLLLAR